MEPRSENMVESSGLLVIVICHGVGNREVRGTSQDPRSCRLPSSLCLPQAFPEILIRILGKYKEE